MLQDIPTPSRDDNRSAVLQTQRLTLRKPVMADAIAVTELANDRRIAENTRRLPHPYSQDHAEQFVGSLETAASDAVFLIELDYRPIGMVGIDWRDPSAPDYWGHGYATEAVRAAIDYTFEEFAIDHLIAGARVANPASRNILEKCGFQWTGVQLHRFEAIGSSTPVDCFKLTRGVWSSLKNWASSTRR
jgi:RimJ/RimL family protein N-acetyltransferase